MVGEKTPGESSVTSKDTVFTAVTSLGERVKLY